MKEIEYEERLSQLEEQQHLALSRISHEIRNPVTLINSFLQLIETQHPQVRDFDYWADTMDNLEFLKNLLRELSDYNNSKALHKVSVNFYDFMMQLVKSLEPVMEPLHVHINLVKESALPDIDLDTTKFREAILNLIRNSQEAMPDGGEICLKLHCDGAYFYLSIEDTGSGIKDEYMETLFQPFITHKKEGTGLGLAITKNVIDSHGGSIQIMSHENKGTTFLISLPVA
ncbi:MAG: HAMP domain-containing sensor histidine kinase [Lachnospiraceae bacterium]|nr:HAMP domain-containing sensor histidine kinase [Lachnospiraceae bacterium]MDD3614786.1 HAMP domain-containing sensor histidine kinase [Lachnospiraceae bacterium]